MSEMLMAKGGQTVDIGRGKRAEFVRWHLTRDGWVPEIVAGTFVGLTKTGWELTSSTGATILLERGEWDWVHP